MLFIRRHFEKGHGTHFEIYIGYKIVAGPFAVCISIGFDRQVY
jgi:hypothetical protein